MDKTPVAWIAEVGAGTFYGPYTKISDLTKDMKKELGLCTVWSIRPVYSLKEQSDDE